MSSPSNEQLISRKERVIPISLRGLWDGLTKILIDAPKSAVAYIARKGDSLSQHMMTGRMAFITMPAALMLRNAARTTYGITTENRGWGSFTHNTLAVLGGGAGWWFAGKAAAAHLATTGFGAMAGTWGTFIGAAIVSAPAIIPAVGATVVAGALVAGAAVAVASIIPAVANIDKAFIRTIDAWKGLKYSQKDIANANIDENGSLASAYAEQRMHRAINDLTHLPPPLLVKAHEALTPFFRHAAEQQMHNGAKPQAPYAAPKP